jgi:hypothetical protein
VTPARFTKRRLAPGSFAWSKLAWARFAPVRIAFDKFVLDRFAPAKNASVKLAPARFAPDRSAPDRFQWINTAPDKSQSTQLLVVFSFWRSASLKADAVPKVIPRQRTRISIAKTTLFIGDLLSYHVITDSLPCHPLCLIRERSR